MSYQIHITSVAMRDLHSAADHVEFVLKNPKAAEDLLNEAERQINSLSDFPEKFRLADDPILASWVIRFIIIDHYLAFYIVNQEKNLVIIVRFLYQKSNWNAILRQGISLV